MNQFLLIYWVQPNEKFWMYGSDEPQWGLAIIHFSQNRFN